jgi:hypothetical protein
MRPGASIEAFLREACGNVGTVLRLLRENSYDRAAASRPLKGDAVIENQSLPVLDGIALTFLEVEAGDPVTRRFVEEYLLMLPVRAARILKGLAGEDPEPGGQALMSLRVTSSMVGALRLEGL